MLAALRPRFVIGLAGAGWSRFATLVDLSRIATGRALGLFWLVLLTALASGGLTMHLLGPLPAPQADAHHHDSVPRVPAVRPQAGIASPIAALQEPVPGQPGTFLPRITADGQTPMRAYAAPFADHGGRPRIGVLVVGMGLNTADSEAAIRTLPAPVSLGFSPYADRPAPLLEAARAAGHEFLISLPLEPAGTPLHDAGDQVLLPGASAEQNARRLEWSLARIGGYVGATGALGALRGERFAEAGQPMREMMAALTARGLLYIDPRPNAAVARPAFGRAVDLVIDSSAQATMIDDSLYRLEQTAREHGSALGLAGAPLPLTIGRLAAWAAGLEARGFVLTPVSALVVPPAPSTAAGAPPPVEHRH